MQRFYRIAIWLPIVLPAVAWICVELFGQPISDTLSSFVGILFLSLALGGIPYVLLAAWATWRTRSYDERRMRRLALWAPVLMLIPFFPFAFVMGALDGDPWRGGIVLFAIGALYILGLGYLYVAVVLSLGLLLRVHRHRDDAASLAP